MKMKKFLVGVMNLSFVLVPVCLLTWGLYLATGPLWDALLIAAVILIWTVAFKKYGQVRANKEQLGSAQAIVAMTGIFAAFLPLALQLLFCDGVNEIPCETSMAWMFLVGTIAGFYQLRHDKPLLKSVTTSMYFGYSFTAICAVACLFDLFSYFTGLDIPQRICDFLGILVPICAVGCILFFIIGLVQDRTVRR